jgi:hypothetical protein
MQLSGNKGEWSEIYALLKLLGDQTLFAGDINLNKIEDLFYPIIKILREEVSGKYEYRTDSDIHIYCNGEEKLIISAETFKKEAAILFNEIKNKSGSFSIPETEAFLKSIHCSTLKAKSNDKADIHIVIHDLRTNIESNLGFSIKSQLGSPSTLLNASIPTNFLFKIIGSIIPTDEVDRINSISSKSKIKDRISEIKKHNCQLQFSEIENPIFRNNLILIDSLLPDFLAEILLMFFSSSCNFTKELVSKVEKANPLNYDMQHAHDFYKYKIKRFLTDVALGMKPAEVWNGVFDATGGYLVVKAVGDILCYHIYNKNEFENYLFAHTKLETPSSTRHEFGTIFEINGVQYMRLNLQIRFAH